MDSLNHDRDHYREIIKNILIEHSKLKPVYGEIEMQLVFDEIHDHYQVVRAGWLNKSRVYGVLIQIDLKGDQVWVQYDGTEVGVANELAEAGIPRQNIILAYQPPLIRAHSGFGAIV